MTKTNWTFQTKRSLVESHGLKIDEFEKIVEGLGREPNITELGIFSAMWNEHCSYKSSKYWLKKLPTTGERVIQGPGENAGVIDIDDGDVAVFKMESHNHPSFLEPYQGAATGVGGILRDVFTMGARPVANMNALRFGEPDHPKTKHLLSGVVGGIGGYGNCIGIPTVGGEVNFHPSYNGNILVNAMTVGIAKKNKIFYSAAAGIGNPVVYVGSKTGRDGIHGATMASAEFDDDSDEKKPTVQVGDPFTEKLLLEACLELMKEEAIIAIQDMGAAGLTSSSIEMASKGNVGIDINLSKVPMRAANMTAYELMLSESQERMLIILEDGKEDEENTDIINRESSKVQAVIARAAVTTFINNVSNKRSIYLGVRGNEIIKKESREYKIAFEASPISHVSTDDPPVLLFHGDKDLTVPIFHSLIMLDSLTKYGVESKLIEIKNAKHGPSFKGAINLPDLDSIRMNWFNKHLIEK